MQEDNKTRKVSCDPKRIATLGVSRRWLRRLALALVLLGVAALGLIGYVLVGTRSATVADVTSAPEEPVAIVFGAGIDSPDRLSLMLADRVQAAVQLYHEGRVHKLLMTGDNGRTSHDEPTAMQNYAMAHGVPADDIVLDYAGFSTYESCYRARTIFGITHAVLVTQAYHLPRALYTCRGLGIDVVGVGTRDWGVYSLDMMTVYTLREGPAILKALWEVNVTHPLPTFLGPYEGWRLRQS